MYLQTKQNTVKDPCAQLTTTLHHSANKRYVNLDRYAAASVFVFIATLVFVERVSSVLDLRDWSLYSKSHSV
jgi:hypothetical protein